MFDRLSVIGAQQARFASQQRGGAGSGELAKECAALFSSIHD
jgi:hypothetical protein